MAAVHRVCAGWQAQSSMTWALPACQRVPVSIVFGLHTQEPASARTTFPASSAAAASTASQSAAAGAVRLCCRVGWHPMDLRLAQHRHLRTEPHCRDPGHGRASFQRLRGRGAPSIAACNLYDPDGEVAQR